MKAWPSLLAVLALTGCKYGSKMEAYESSRKYIIDWGTSEVTFMGKEFRGKQVPNLRFELVLDQNAKANKVGGIAVDKCRSYKHTSYVRGFKEGD